MPGTKSNQNKKNSKKKSSKSKSSSSKSKSSSKSSNNNSIDNCPICLEKMEKTDNLKILQCQHKLHKECFKLSEGQMSRCPRCQADIKTGLAQATLAQQNAITEDRFREDYGMTSAEFEEYMRTGNVPAGYTGNMRNLGQLRTRRIESQMTQRRRDERNSERMGEFQRICECGNITDRINCQFCRKRLKYGTRENMNSRGPRKLRGKINVKNAKRQFYNESGRRYPQYNETGSANESLNRRRLGRTRGINYLPENLSQLKQTKKKKKKGK